MKALSDTSEKVKIPLSWRKKVYFMEELDGIHLAVQDTFCRVDRWHFLALYPIPIQVNGDAGSDLVHVGSSPRCVTNWELSRSSSSTFSPVSEEEEESRPVIKEKFRGGHAGTLICNQEKTRPLVLWLQ